MRGFVVLLALLLSGCGAIKKADPDEAIIERCENSIKNRLKAPSTYKRISASADKIDNDPIAEIRDYGKTIRAEQTVDIILRNRPKTNPPYYRVIVEYDASNMMGVPIRSTNMCWLGTPADKKYASENHLLAPITDTAFIEMLEDVSEAQKRELQLGR